MSVTVRAAAKINLHLGVAAPRADGFHPLDTVYQAVSLYDDLTATRADERSLVVTTGTHIGADAVPLGDDNIVWRAAEVLARHHDRPEFAVAVEVRKEIPVAGGMAGGSADAAAMLVALDRLFDLNTSDADLLRLAAELGSDIPFSLLGGTAHGIGRGEQVHAVPDAHTWHWVIVPATGEGLSTPAVYGHFDKLNPGVGDTPAPALPLLQALAQGDPRGLAAALHNDLQAAALDLRPDLAETMARGERAGALRGLVSGSGPTVVLLAESAPAARDLAAALVGVHPGVVVAHGPVAGAHVVRH